MEIPKRAEQAWGRLQRAARAWSAETTSEADPEIPAPGDPTQAVQTTEKWRDGKFGFIDAQLGDAERMSRYNVHLIIKMMGRSAGATLPAALGGTGYILRESDTRALTVCLVLLTWLVSIAAAVGAVVLSKVSSPRPSTKKAISETEREIKEASNPKTGDDGDHSGHHAPNQQ